MPTGFWWMLANPPQTLKRNSMFIDTFQSTLFMDFLPVSRGWLPRRSQITIVPEITIAIVGL
jgi:hypothetical protein